MKVGIIVYSKTGNTYSVVEKIRERLSKASHSVTVERLSPIGEITPMTKKCRFEGLPDLGRYDALLFGSFVQGFSLTPAMKVYMSGLEAMNGRKVALLVTQHLTHAWMGGNQAVRAMKTACESKGAVVRGSGIVHWSSPKRDEQIDEVVEALSRLF